MEPLLRVIPVPKLFLKLSSPPKFAYLMANLMLIVCIPTRLSYYVDKNPQARIVEDELIAYAAVGSWLMMLFFAG